MTMDRSTKELAQKSLQSRGLGFCFGGFPGWRLGRFLCILRMFIGSILRILLSFPWPSLWVISWAIGLPLFLRLMILVSVLIPFRITRWSAAITRFFTVVSRSLPVLLFSRLVGRSMLWFKVAEIIPQFGWIQWINFTDGCSEYGGSATIFQWFFIGSVPTGTNSGFHKIFVFGSVNWGTEWNEFSVFKGVWMLHLQKSGQRQGKAC